MLKIGNKEFSSRLFLGTGRYENLKIMQQCHLESQTQLVTVSLKKMNLDSPRDQGLMGFIDSKKITLLANTAGAKTANEVFRLAKICVALNITFLKIEVMYETKTLLPDIIETHKALKLIKEDHQTKHINCMVYTNDDPISALKLLEVGASAIMPGGSPIGSGRGISNLYNMKLILELIDNRVPVILDAGIGTTSHACEAMELGFDAVLLNTAIAKAKSPIKMAKAMSLAVEAGRGCFEAGAISPKIYATASSPIENY